MTTETLSKKYALDEAAAQKILSSPRTKVNQTNIFSDLMLDKDERVANAKRILKSRKCR
ncbi:hypothetical protein [Bhargavaea cecembensis]|uniref:hypothetical protein n=1 Tax=Bhargavaea cecembensis TaxID=394098 RepID=UPI0015CF0827|nr:hypothetical protein [Bhargavaea cecembensis]